MTTRFRTTCLAVLLALLVPLQAMAGIGGACCHDEANGTATTPSAEAAHHAADDHDNRPAPASAEHAGCDSDILSCCHASTLAAPAAWVTPAVAGMAMIPATPRTAVVDPPRSGPDRPPRPHTA